VKNNLRLRLAVNFLTRLRIWGRLLGKTVALSLDKAKVIPWGLLSGTWSSIEKGPGNEVRGGNRDWS